MKHTLTRLAGLLAAMPLLASAQTQLDLTTLDQDMAGPRSHILVLGTVHLNSMPDGFNRAALDGLLDRLATFAPDIITIEMESGEECDLAARHPQKYGADYCASTAEAMAATGLDVPAAMAEVERTLRQWSTQPAPSAQPTPAQRRRLASAMLASNDAASAYVQWLQLPVAERRAGDGLDAALVRKLVKLDTRNNENEQIAARLAARLKLQRVHAVDNHTGDRIDVPDIKAFVRSIEAAWAAGGADLKAAEAGQEKLLRAADLLPLYRQLNAPATLRLYADANVRAAMQAGSPQGYPQMWVAGWEIRNLRMVANIRETFRERPGARVLSIVGVSHKPWFDAWLGQLQGIEMVDVQQVLK